MITDGFDRWSSLDVDYHPPRVERLHRPFEDGRVFLHVIHPCEMNDALCHPHPWPSAMEVLEGTYRMRIGVGPGIDATHRCLVDSIVSVRGTARYQYAMTDPDGWHAVAPIGDIVMTIMVTGPHWQRPIPEITRCAGPHRTLSDARKRLLLERFAAFV